MFKLIPAKVDGCAVGVVDNSGKNKIKKPWCFACSDPKLAAVLDKQQCDKTHNHVPCAGQETLNTGF